jgi:hypothetical protein
MARTIVRVAAPWSLLAFGCAGVHLHFVALCNHEEAGEIARRLEIGLQRTRSFGVPFLKVHRKELVDQQHLFSAVLYDIGQRRHHELAADPYLEATSAPDLLGARLLGSHLIPRIREHVPELKRGHILAAFGLADSTLASEATDPERLREAVLAAAALPAFSGKGPDMQVARAVFIALAPPSIRSGDLADLCRVATRSIPRLRKLPVPPELLRAAGVQLALRQRVDALTEPARLPG